MPEWYHYKCEIPHLVSYLFFIQLDICACVCTTAHMCGVEDSLWESALSTTCVLCSTLIFLTIEKIQGGWAGLGCMVWHFLSDLLSWISPEALGSLFLCFLITTLWALWYWELKLEADPEMSPTVALRSPEQMWGSLSAVFTLSFPPHFLFYSRLIYCLSLWNLGQTYWWKMSTLKRLTSKD